MSKKSGVVGESKKNIRYWWDVWWKDGKMMGVEVCSSHPDYAIVFRLYCIEENGWDQWYKFAQDVVDDLKSGRTTLKQAREHNEVN